MALAQGIGLPIAGGGLAVKAYSRIYAQVQPLTGAADPGRRDGEGRNLHFRYECNLNLGARSGGNQNTNVTTYTNSAVPSAATVPVDFMPNRLVVEFDSQSFFTLPFDGQLYLVGGKGEWKFGITVLDVLCAEYYKPELRLLSTVQEKNSPFVVPDNHTYISGGDGAILQATAGLANQYTLSNNLPGTIVTPGVEYLILPASPAPICTIFTGWLG